MHGDGRLKCLTRVWFGGVGVNKRLTGLMLVVFVAPLVVAASSLSPTPSEAIQGVLCGLVTPAVQAAAAIAVLALVWVGVEFFASGNNVVKRQSVKDNLVYVVVGLLLIVLAPYIVALFTNTASCPIV